MREQSRRHGYLLHLMGVRQLAVVVNKMDTIGFEKDQFDLIEEEYRDYLAAIGLDPQVFIPISAREGDNIVGRSERTPWYEGPTILEALDGFAPHAAPVDLPLRLPVQDVYKFDERRIIAGRIESGTFQVGDDVVFSPSNKTGRIASIESWTSTTGNPRPIETSAGHSVGITLDEQIFVERGEIMSHIENAPIETDVFRARIFWLGREPLSLNKTYKLKLSTGEASAQIQSIERIIDTGNLSSVEAQTVERNQVAEVVVRTRRMVALDEFDDNARTGRFVLSEGYQIVGGGIIFMEGYADQRSLITQRATNITRVEPRISLGERSARNGHKGGVIWLTGLSGAGKSTIAVELERRLFEHGFNAFVLDGDNVRHGLNANLGFSPEDRAENIRRVGEVAALMAEAGMVVITAFISPYRSDRDRAREAAGDVFHEVYVEADLATCESRDPKGLYKKAREGEIKDFTGISAPYEAPEKPDLTVNTSDLSVDESVGAVAAYVEKTLRA